MEVYNLKEQLSLLPLVMTLEYDEWADHKDENREERIQKKIKQYYEYMDEPYYCKLVLMDQGMLIGFISLFPKDGVEEENLSPWYATMYVLPEYRGLGYSKYLHGALVKEALKRGIDTLYLKTDLVHFYEKFGARFIKELGNGKRLYQLNLHGNFNMYSFYELFPYYTERLYVRPTTVEDVSLLLKMDSQEETQKYLGGVKHASEPERTLFLEKKIQSFEKRELIPFTVCLKEGIPVGFIDLKKLDDSDMEISYIFDYDYWKKGYCTEAVQKILTKAFDCLDVEKVIAYTLPDNMNSTRVLQKNGFEVQGEKDDFQIYECFSREEGEE